MNTDFLYIRLKHQTSREPFRKLACHGLQCLALPATTREWQRFTKKIADDNAAALRLQAELSVALCFDVSVQNGGLKQSGVARVKEALLFTTLTM